VQFSATVTGTSDHRLSWNVSEGGSISGTGLFRAGTSPGIFTVTAVSLAERSSVGTAFVQVTSGDVTGLYEGEGTCENSVYRSCPTPFPAKVRIQCCNGGMLTWDVNEFRPYEVPYKVASFGCGRVLTNVGISGGSFRGTMLGCLEPWFVEGTIGGGSLTLTVYATSVFVVGDVVPLEHYDLRKSG
jgi:hypothetical protein